ncbi:MAG: Gfo/Idh/MocA family protein [Verrucomicrobiota bacterium]
MSAKPINVGIAGLGRSGWNIHARLFDIVGTRKYRITAVYDPDMNRMKEAKDKYGCELYSSYRKLIAAPEVELVVVAVPSHLHAKYTIDALQCGKHVVCEKPMAGSVRQADSMIRAAKKSGKVLTIFQNRRYQADFQQVKKIIDSGKLGRIVQIRMAQHKFTRRWDWQTLKKFGGGTTSNTAVHTLDQALQLFGERMPKVFCLRDRALTLGDADDHVKIVLHGKGAPTIEVEETAACAYPQNKWLIMGTRGGLTGSERELRWKYFKNKTLPRKEVEIEPIPDRTYINEKLPMVEKEWTSNVKGRQLEANFYNDLYRCIRAGGPVPVGAESVRRQIAILEKCRRMAPV